MAGPLRTFGAGERIVHRSVDRASGVIMTVLAQIVVRDEPGAIVTYMPEGSLRKRRSGDRSGGPRGRQLVRWDGGYEDVTWSRTHVLMVHRPGDAFSVWTAWSAAEWRHVWSYVNLEEPWRRIPIGFDSRDLWLDLWSEPGSQEWHWKDEDELAWAVEAGRCTLERARAIRRAGESALEALDRREPPFDEAWADWRPDPRWPVPTVPPEWKDVVP